MIFITRLKVILRTKPIVFWIFIFPLALATFFYFGFGKISGADQIETTDVYVVTSGDYSIATDPYLYYQLNNTMIDEDTHLFSVKELASLDEGNLKLEAKEINAYIYIENSVIRLKTNKPDMTSVIVMNAFLDSYATAKEIAASAVAAGITDSNEIAQMIASYLSDTSYLADAFESKNANNFVIYFYGLIAMMCMYGCFLGVMIISDVRADRSDLGVRIGITPTNKFKTLLMYLLASYVLTIIGNTIMFIYLKYILGVEFGSNSLLILAVMYLGSLSGMGLGMVISTLVKSSSSDKAINVSNAISLILSFFAGLMSNSVKHMIDTALPFFNIVSPAGSVANALYGLYYYDNYDLYSTSLISLAISAVIFFMFTFFKMRGEKYESI